MTVPPYWFYCHTCHKRGYRTRKQARRASRIAHPGHHLATYHCPHRPGWHIGHLNPTARDQDRHSRTTRNQP